jgi:hypothetical protein
MEQLSNAKVKPQSSKKVGAGHRSAKTTASTSQAFLSADHEKAHELLLSFGQILLDMGVMERNVIGAFFASVATKPEQAQAIASHLGCLRSCWVKSDPPVAQLYQFPDLNPTRHSAAQV